MDPSKLLSSLSSATAKGLEGIARDGLFTAQTLTDPTPAVGASADTAGSSADEAADGDGQQQQQRRGRRKHHHHHRKGGASGAASW